jgi:hypothetical protein
LVVSSSKPSARFADFALKTMGRQVYGFGP